MLGYRKPAHRSYATGWTMPRWRLYFTLGDQPSAASGLANPHNLPVTIIRHHTLEFEYTMPGPALGPESAILPHIILPRAQNMAGQSMFGPGTGWVAGLPWLKSATVSLWRRAPRWSTRAMTWVWEAAVALAFLAFVIFASIMVLYAAYTLGSLAIFVRHLFR